MHQKTKQGLGPLQAAVATSLLALFFAGSTCHAHQRDTSQQQDSTGAAAPANAAQQWIGTRYPPLPGSVTDRGGATVGNALHARFAINDVVAGGRHLLWLTRLTGRKPSGEAISVVTDVLTAPGTAANQAIYYAGLCGRLPPEAPPAGQLKPSDVTLDPKIVAFVKPDESVWAQKDIQEAWRVDRASVRFVPIRQTDLLVCFSETPPSYSE